MTSYVLRSQWCRRGFLCAVAGLMLVMPGDLPAQERALDFEALLEGRRAIEEVYWRNRIWPDQDTGPKPALAEVLPETILVTRVENSLRLSTVLAERWNQPITSAQLQAELDRMIRDSAAPDVLLELFEAVDNDARLAAECLARPLLADRLAREAFAMNESLHSAARTEAHAAAVRLRSAGDMKRMGGAYLELEWVLWGAGVAKHERLHEEGAAARLVLDPEAWSRLTTRLDSGIAGAGVGMLGPLREESDRFVITTVLERTRDRVKVASVTWPKREFDDWWAEVRDHYPASLPKTTSAFRLTPPKSRDIGPDSWQTMASFGSPLSARTRHSAVWTGSEMLIWGGTEGESVFHNGSGYDPATDSWTAMNSTGHPDARADHTAVWTGTRMIVWGGWRGPLVNSGGVYNVATNTWSSTDTDAAPSARRYHTAVFATTGKMIVWGGWDGSAYRGDGKRYSYSSDTWMTMSSDGAPSARSDHTAVFYTSPQKMLVWGGQNTSGVLGDGARYDDSFNSWSSMSTVGDPSARMGHSATYFASSQSYDRGMFVWGGFNGSNTVTSGSFYNASYNTWKTSSFSGAPAGRQGHTAVTTGLTMIIWGGYTGATLRNSGGVFNPFNNVWKSTTTSSAPAARKGHTAAWRPQTLSTTNGEMMVWGGYHGDETATGGRYAEPTDFVISASPWGVTTVPSATENGITTARVHSLGDFTSPVTFSCSTGPVYCSFASNPVSPPSNSFVSSSVNLVISNGLALGEYFFDIKGTSGGTTRSYEFKLYIRDFDVACSPSAFNVPPGGTVQTTCTVSSLNGFHDSTDLVCSFFDCSFSPGTVTPPADGTVDSTLTLTAPTSPGSYVEEVGAESHNTYRLFELTIEVGEDDLIFSNGFESGNTSAWSAAVQ